MPKPFKRRRKVCEFCERHETEVDYKDVATLKKYISERGKIYQEELQEPAQNISVR